MKIYLPEIKFVITEYNLWPQNEIPSHKNEICSQKSKLVPTKNHGAKFFPRK
jgi:hypothetical protein